MRGSSASFWRTYFLDFIITPVPLSHFKFLVRECTSAICEELMSLQVQLWSSSTLPLYTVCAVLRLAGWRHHGAHVWRCNQTDPTVLLEIWQCKYPLGSIGELWDSRQNWWGMPQLSDAATDKTCMQDVANTGYTLRVLTSSTTRSVSSRRWSQFGKRPSRGRSTSWTTYQVVLISLRFGMWWKTI
jgi:hypothetical protein